MSVEDLVVEHAEWIRNKARWFYSNREHADDLAGETIFRCLSQGAKFEANRSFKPWALTIMTNTYITQYNRRRCVLFTSNHDNAIDICHSESADQLAAVNSILKVVHECSNKTVNMECVMLYAQGFSQQEIAARLGLPLGTVKSRISLGRKLLRKLLDK